MSEIIKIPINADDGIAKTIMAGCYKFGAATLLLGKYGTTMTSILELKPYERRNEDSNRRSSTDKGMA